MLYVDTPGSPKISKIGLGTAQFAAREWEYGEAHGTSAAAAVTRRAVELGVTLFDTAEIYGFDPHPFVRRALVRGIAVSDPARIAGFGTGERLLGQALAGAETPLVVATKLYPTWPVRPDVEEHALASAARLRVRPIGLYQVHIGAIWSRPASVMRAIARLRDSAVVAEVGVSNASLEDWQGAEDALRARVLSNQVRYSLLDRSAEQELIPFAEAHQRLVIAASPLGQGLLSGRYDATHRPTNRARATAPPFLPENLERAAPLLETLRELASAHWATPVQVAIAWVLRHPCVVAVPAAVTIGQLEENVAATELSLTANEFEALDNASAAFHARRGRADVVRRLRALTSR